MAVTVSPNQDDIFLALWTVLTGIVSAGSEVVRGQDNRVPEPREGSYLVMTFMRQQRLATNIDDYVDCVFTASIAGTVMTVSSVATGQIAVGAQVFGTGIASPTTITGALSGTGGPGTYSVSPSQVAAAQPLAAGTASMTQKTMVVFQVDSHGPDGADNAQVVSTFLRDPYGVDAFAAVNPAIAPLYADDPRQIPFISGEQQYEDRWSIEVALQANQVVTGIPQQFADALSVQLEMIP
jgi:hypothetical protein